MTGCDACMMRHSDEKFINQLVKCRKPEVGSSTPFGAGRGAGRRSRGDG